MPMIRYSLSPWRELEQLGQRLVARGDAFSFGDRPAWTSSGGWAPPVSIEETQDALLLTAELPGVRPENIELQVENNVLTIRGEKREARTEDTDDRRYHLWERTYGSFARAFTLPRSVHTEGISAGFQDGLLTVRLPKAPEAKSHKVPINGAVGSKAE